MGEDAGDVVPAVGAALGRGPGGAALGAEEVWRVEAGEVVAAGAAVDVDGGRVGEEEDEDGDGADEGAEGDDEADDVPGLESGDAEKPELDEGELDDGDAGHAGEDDADAAPGAPVLPDEEPDEGGIEGEQQHAVGTGGFGGSVEPDAG